VSEDHQWRQLGSIVNQVLMDTRTKAVRSGTQSKASPRPIAGKTQQRSAGLVAKKLGHGFLNPEYEATPSAQLELPFGIEAETNFYKRSAKGARLM
jgi:hypothetical protein